MAARMQAAWLVMALAPGLALCQPTSETMRKAQVDLLVARLTPEAWDALKGALSRSVTPVAAQGKDAEGVAGVLRPGQPDMTRILGKLETRGQARILGMPRLTTWCGKPVNFLDGGEVPVPVPPGTQPAGVQFQEVGNRASCVPEVAGNGNFRLTLEQSISVLEPVPAGDEQSAGTHRLVTTRLSATAELPPDGVFVLGGLPGRGRRTELASLPVLRGLPLLRGVICWEQDVEEDYVLLVLAKPHLLPEGK
jgi:pilus assembly protein CpaC